ncbi:alpha-galactosidase/6-phospho-beta-glucosidase family protein, partial [Paenibacillus sacheonensis]|nr:alpha-galactosidase/6-phospho-beta-glucosidase family protein [Paenibacillus sacheonensis]
MRRVAIIGAGSVVFCKTLILDIMATEVLEETEFVLMAPSTTKTTHVKSYIDRVIAQNNLKARVSITTDRREALAGANYVICSFQIGGLTAFELDYKIPLKYGVDQCIGDTLGPGGVFRALRSIPVILDV